MKLFPTFGPLEVVTMDILGPLLISTKKNQLISAIYDRFSKVTQYFSLRTVAASTCTIEFFHGWVHHYGVPTHVLTDRGKQFVAQLFRNLCGPLGIYRVLTTAYYPQTNRQTKRYNKMTIASIRLFIAEHQRNLNIFLASLMFVHNAHVHCSTNFRPFEIAHHQFPPDA